MQLGASGCGWCGHISQLTQPYLHYLVVTFCGGSFLLSNYGTTRACFTHPPPSGCCPVFFPTFAAMQIPKESSNSLIYIQNQTI